MDFTELFKQSSGQVFPSPSHEHIATIFQNKVVVRDAESLEPVRSFTGTDMLSDLEWSPDGNYVLVCGYKTDTVYVWCVWKKEWNARIDETIVGLAGARWGPDSRHVLTYSSFDLRLTIWPLTGEEPKYIQNPKKLDKGGFIGEMWVRRGEIHRTHEIYRDCVSEGE
jgi:WD40 repeat protein